MMVKELTQNHGTTMETQRQHILRNVLADLESLHERTRDPETKAITGALLPVIEILLIADDRTTLHDERYMANFLKSPRFEKERL